MGGKWIEEEFDEAFPDPPFEEEFEPELWEYENYVKEEKIRKRRPPKREGKPLKGGKGMKRRRAF